MTDNESTPFSALPSIKSDRFTITGELGAGGMGVVYAAYDKKLEINVALKTLQNANSEALLRLKKEFRALRSLEHPNLVTIGELFEDHGTWFFTMEYVEGRQLLAYVRQPFSLDEFNLDQLSREPSSHTDAFNTNHSTLDLPDEDLARRAMPEEPVQLLFNESRLRSALHQLAQGLMALHASGRLHRDVKPDNILVEESGRVVLMDFGLVTETEQNLRTLSHFFPVGTSAYMSPEQAASAPLTPASDWYSVGVILFHALTGRLPFEGSFASVILDKQKHESPSPRSFCPEVPEDLNQLCADLIQISPEARPTGQEVIKRLRQGSRQESVSSHSYMRSLSLFEGRDKELQWMDQRFASFLEGDPTAVLIHGASGLGKSGLIRKFLSRIGSSREDLIIFSGSCNEQESVSFKAFDQIIDALSQLLLKIPGNIRYYVIPKNAALLTRLFPTLSRVEAMDQPIISSKKTKNVQEFRSIAFAALRELFERLTSHYRVVLFIDNFQWADEDSHKLLQGLLQPPTPPNLFILVGMRTSSEPVAAAAEAAAVSEIFPVPLATLPLLPLSQEESAKMAMNLHASMHREHPVPERVWQDIARESGGHPLFIFELVQHFITNPEQYGERSFPQLEQVLQEHISQLPDMEREVLEMICLAHSALSSRTLAHVLQTTQGELVRVCNRLQVMHLIRSGARDDTRQFEPFHDRVRDCVVARLDAETGAAAHRRLALALLTEPGARPEALAFHFEGGREPEQAMKYYLQAAHSANEGLAFQRAAMLFHRALKLHERQDVVSEKGRREVRILLAGALANAGSGQAAAQEYLAAVPGANSAQALALKQRAGDVLLRSGHMEAGMEILNEMFASLNISLPRPGWRTWVSLVWTRLKLRFRGLSFTTTDESEIPSADLARLDLYSSLSKASSNVIQSVIFATRWAYDALNMGEPQRILQALCIEANYLAASGQFTSPYHAKIIAVVEGIIEQYDKPILHGYMKASSAYGNYMSGNFKEAYETAREGLELMLQAEESFWEQGHMRMVQIWSLYYLGEIKEMTRIGSSFYYDAMARDDMWSASGAILGLGNLAFMQLMGPEKSRAEADRFMKGWSQRGYHLQHFFQLVSALHTDLYLGDDQAAFDRLQEQWRPIKKALLLLIPSIRNEAHYFQSHIALNLASEKGRNANPLMKLAKRGIRQMYKARAPWPTAMAHLLEAEIALRTGHEDEAITGFTETIAELDRLKMRLHSSTLRHKVGRLIQGDQGAELLREAGAFFERQQITDPDALTRMLLP